MVMIFITIISGMHFYKNPCKHVVNSIITSMGMMSKMATSSTGCGTLTFSIMCGLRGYHENRCMWSSKLNKVPPAKHERNNPHDWYVIATFKQLQQTDENRQAIAIYKTLVNERYKESVDGD